MGTTTVKSPATIGKPIEGLDCGEDYLLNFDASVKVRYNDRVGLYQASYYGKNLVVHGTALINEKTAVNTVNLMLLALEDKPDYEGKLPQRRAVE